MQPFGFPSAHAAVSNPLEPPTSAFPFRMPDPGVLGIHRSASSALCLSFVAHLRPVLLTPCKHPQPCSPYSQCQCQDVPAGGRAGCLRVERWALGPRTAVTVSRPHGLWTSATAHQILMARLRWARYQMPKVETSTCELRIVRRGCDRTRGCSTTKLPCSPMFSFLPYHLLHHSLDTCCHSL